MEQDIEYIIQFKQQIIQMRPAPLVSNLDRNQTRQSPLSERGPHSQSIRNRFQTIANNHQLHRPDHQPVQSARTIKPQKPKQPNMSEVSQKLQYRSQQNQNSHSMIQPLYTPKHSSNLYSVQQIQIHKKMIQNMWDYRYWRLVTNAIKDKDWMPVFAFIGEFKLKCSQLAKCLVKEKFNRKQIDRIDHRYQLKGQGQIGIFLIDGIIVRVAKLRKIKKQIDKRAQKNLHQQYISYNIVNDLIISLSTEMPNFPTLRVPVTCLIKYMGYTFLCQGDTMCNGIQTLIYGPMSSTFKYQESITQLLNIIGRNLNLKSFKVLTANKNIIQIPFCLTVELHQVNLAFRDMGIISWFNADSRIFPHHQKQNKLLKPEYYLLSFSKLWPLFIDSNIVKSSGYLRPQAVLSWKKQLSNAVFSTIAFQKDQQGQLQLAQACKSVKQERIKQLAMFLDQATFFVVDSAGIQQIMHHYHINIRFLGLMAHKLTLASNRKVFQVQMVARVLKKIFYTNLQGFQDKYHIKDLLVDFLNLVFIQSPEGQKFYMDVVYPQVQKYYDYQINQYPPNFSGGGLLHAISYHLGVKVKIIDYPFYKQIQAIFTPSYIIDIVPLVRSFGLETCLLKKSCQKFKIKKKQGLLTQCITQLNLLAMVTHLSCPDGTYSSGSAPQSYFYSQLAEVYRYMGDYEQTNKYAELALKGIPQKHADTIKSYCTLIRYHSWKKQINRCLQYYQKSLATLNYHLHQNHPLSISVHNTLGFEFLASADPSKCQKIFAKSFEICQQALGYMHSTSGKILLQLADLPLPPQKTINFLLQALTILQNIQTDKSKVTAVCQKISEMYAKIGNLTKMIQFARKSDHWRNEIVALQKLNEHKMVLQKCNRVAKSVQQLKFLVQKSFSSYLKLLDHKTSFNLYKMFVSLVDHLPKQQIASQRIYKKLDSQSSITLTIVQFVKTSLNNLSSEIPDLLKEPDFFVGSHFLLEYRQGRFKSVILSYMDILAIVGPQKSELIFTDFRKTF